MGKVRRLRQKYHLSKVQEKKSTKQPTETNSEKPSESLTKQNIASNENIFAGLDISFDSLTKSLPVDFDAKSIASSKSRKEQKLEEQHLKKRVKLKLRRDRFLQKLDVTQRLLKQAKDKKKRDKLSEADECNPSMDILPSLDFLLGNNHNKSMKLQKGKVKGIVKMKKRLRQQTYDAKLMKRIVNDKKFQANPGKTILDFLKDKVAREM